MGSKKRFFGCIKRRKKRADEGIGPYKGQQKVEAHPANRKTAPA